MQTPQLCRNITSIQRHFVPPAKRRGSVFGGICLYRNSDLSDAGYISGSITPESLDVYSFLVWGYGLDQGIHYTRI